MRVYGSTEAPIITLGWRNDAQLAATTDGPSAAPPENLLTDIRCRVALFRAEFGLVTPDIGDFMYEKLGRVAPVIEVPLAWHHVMLDQPIPLLTGLRTLLADWEHSTPHRRR